MALATADASGRPWASPVWYAPRGYREFFWASKPEARHSRNLAQRPELAIVIFDSHEPGCWKAVYMSAVAEELADVDEGIEVYARRSVEQGLRVWTREDVLPPAQHRLYRATVSEHSCSTTTTSGCRSRSNEAGARPRRAPSNESLREASRPSAPRRACAPDGSRAVGCRSRSARTSPCTAR